MGRAAPARAGVARAGMSKYKLGSTVVEAVLIRTFALLAVRSEVICLGCSRLGTPRQGSRPRHTQEVQDRSNNTLLTRLCER